ncbi:MAG: hypothetical protein E5X93_07975 [Mesorhizobium sp.]|nr:MAG: hypothetical protein E5X93_07975 [Mesorhizobium sp.]
MAGSHSKANGPDLVQGIAIADLEDGGKLVGHCGDEQVLLVRRGSEVFAVSATCTHYGGPLVDGLVAEDTVRCPWHHACFDLRTGEALRAPAFSPFACWSVEQRYCQVRRGNEKTRPMGPYTKREVERVQEVRRALIAKRGTARIMFE